MIKNNCAVLTGDLVRSSKIKAEERIQLLKALSELFETINKNTEIELIRPFQIYRGDSFQGVFKNPNHSLMASLLIYTTLGSYPKKWKTRLSIGIGSISFLQKTVGKSDGKAFQRSGQSLDGMKSLGKLLSVNSGDENFDGEMNTLFEMLGYMMQRWTIGHCEVIRDSLIGMNQVSIAQKLTIKQPAVNHRMKAAGWNIIDKVLKRFELKANELITD